MNRMEYYCLTHIDIARGESNDNNDENNEIKRGKKKQKNSSWEKVTS